MIHLSPTEGQQNLVITITVVLMGIVGILALLDASWNYPDWIFYGLGCLFLALYIYLMSTQPFELFLMLSLLCYLLFVLFLHLLASNLNSGNLHSLPLANIVEAIEGIWFIWLLYMLAQDAFYSDTFHFKTPVSAFLILAVLVIVARLWEANFQMMAMIGFLATSLPLTILFVSQQNKEMTPDY